MSPPKSIDWILSPHEMVGEWLAVNEQMEFQGLAHSICWTVMYPFFFVTVKQAGYWNSHHFLHFDSCLKKSSPKIPILKFDLPSILNWEEVFTLFLPSGSTMSAPTVTMDKIKYLKIARWRNPWWFFGFLQFFRVVSSDDMANPDPESPTPQLQATKLLVKKDCEARSATAENAQLRDQLVHTTRRTRDGKVKK